MTHSRHGVGNNLRDGWTAILSEEQIGLGQGGPCLSESRIQDESSMIGLDGRFQGTGSPLSRKVSPLEIVVVCVEIPGPERNQQTGGIIGDGDPQLAEKIPGNSVQRSQEAPLLQSILPSPERLPVRRIQKKNVDGSRAAGGEP